jgi:hypothetical protein
VTQRDGDGGLGLLLGVGDLADGNDELNRRVTNHEVRIMKEENRY